MAVGKPIVGAINGSCSNFIFNNSVGYACSSENYEALATLIKKIDLNELKIIGTHSKELYFKKYSKKLFIERSLLELQKLAK